MNGKNVVSKIMTKPVVVVESSATVMEALKLMVDKGIGCVVLTKNREPVGMLTERDIVKLIIRGREALRSRVEKVMSHPLISVSPDTPVVDAIKLMKEKGITRLPIVKDGQLQGIITIHSDLLYWAIRATNTAESTVQTSKTGNCNAKDSPE